jgi:uncharacterized protein (TIGR03435 family)
MNFTAGGSTMRFCLLAAILSVAAACACQERNSAANGIQRFDVMSVRPDDGPFQPPSFALSADDSFVNPHGRFHADFSLASYIQFAYKLWLTDQERGDMLAGQPDWVRTLRFLMEGVAPERATKDDYRAMMRTLLTERFGLKLHFDTKERSVLAMVLVKDGVPGPKLIPHAQGRPCDAPLQPYDLGCYFYVAHQVQGGMWLNSSRATTMERLADLVGTLGGVSGETTRRVVDRTGLTGQWDFTLLVPEQAKETSAPAPAFTVLEGLRDQLGIRLKSTRATVALPIIDHVQRPSEN